MTTTEPRADTRPAVADVLAAAERVRRPRRIARRVAWAAAVLAVAGGAAWWWTRGDAVATVYVTRPVEVGALTVTVSATGSLAPTREVSVGSEQSGTVARVLVDYNSRVKTGDVLAEIDTDRLDAAASSARAKLAAARASVAEADATVAEKKGDLDRKTVLAARNVSSSMDLDAASAAYRRAVAARESAAAQVEVATADLRVAETNVRKTRILSPIDGVVLTRSVDPGQTVAASLQVAELFTLAEDLSRMELRVDVDEADVGRVAVGQPARFTVDAYPERTFPATIRDIRYASETTQNVVTYKALLEVDNADLALRPGMTATADIVVAEGRDLLLVDNAALRFKPPAAKEEGTNLGLFRVFMPPPPPERRDAAPEAATGRTRTLYLERDGRPVAVPVTVGLSDGTRTAVTGDVRAGDRVIVDAETRG